MPSPWHRDLQLRLVMAPACSYAVPMGESSPAGLMLCLPNSWRTEAHLYIKQDPVGVCHAELSPNITQLCVYFIAEKIQAGLAPGSLIRGQDISAESSADSCVLKEVQESEQMQIYSESSEIFGVTRTGDLSQATCPSFCHPNTNPL